MNISIIGAGYVGLSTGLVLASLGNEVFFIDTDKEKVKRLKKGRLPFQEPLVEELLRIGIKNNSVKFDFTYSGTIPKSEIVFICVSTPPKVNGEADLRYLKNAVKEIAKNLSKKFITIVIKSTVPVGTAGWVRKFLKRTGKNNVAVISNPEFLREGKAVEDTLMPDRIIIGSDSSRASKFLIDLYNPIVKQTFENIIEERSDDEIPLVLTTNESAELIKYASNAFLTTKISFINEIANIAENIGADISDVARGVGLDPRIGDKFLNAGLGWGGSCFPKDTRALHQVAGNSGYMPVLLKAVIEVNNEQKYRFLHKIVENLGGEVSDKTIAVFGLAFKADTDDVRESPGIEIINRLEEIGAKIRAFDPMAVENAKLLFKNRNVELYKDPYEAVKTADVLVITTEWSQFKNLDLNKLKKLLKRAIIIDGRNLFNPAQMKKAGFKYISVGRK